MDVGTNKTRKDTRAVVSLVARYRSPSTFEYVEEACCDVSLGGMFIRSKDPAAAGTLLKLECESGVGGQIRGVARVVWLRGQHSEYGPSGMGVKFVKLDPESRDVITRLVQELAEAGFEAPSMSSAPEHRGKPALSRAPSSTPAAAAAQASQPSLSERVIDSAPSVSQPAPPASNNAAVVHQRSSDRAGAVATAARISSKPPALPPVSSRPAPNDALLAHASLDSLDIGPSPSMQNIGRDLSPLAPVSRSRRISSTPPPPDNDRGRAFWLVAGAIVALGAIVAIFSTRGAQEAAPAEDNANVASRQAEQAPPPPPSIDPNPEPEPAPAQPSAAEAANIQPNGLGADLAAQGIPGTEQAALAAETAQIAPSDNALEPTAAVTQVPIVTPTAAEAPSKAGQPASATTEAAAAPPSAPTRPAASAPSNPGSAQPNTAPAPPPTAAPTAAPAPEVPVLRISPADPAPTQPGAAQPQAAAQPSAQLAPTPSAPAAAAPPSAASSTNSATSQPLAANTSAAQSGTIPATNVQAPSSSVTPPLAPGEVAHIITFTSRPIGASVFVGNQSIVTPAEVNLGAMPARVRVTAQKEGFESSTVWINNVSEFQKVGNALRREVHFVLPSAPTAAVAPAASKSSKPAPAPNSAPAQPSGSASAPAQTAPAQPAAPSQAPNTAPSQPSASAIPPQP